MAKQEAQASRIGLNGRATTQDELQLDGVLGDVYDTQGHLVYDKDYISRMDEDEGVPSLKDGSVHSAKSKDSRNSKVQSSDKKSVSHR
mmetsp:Transcript_41341/g.54373  ORF Transcript_41341/g.54373 Transcript_41341/m.54373 type:complete len:88 (-) Transcript_41341:2058-2321(-)